jgi:hypothetical protein
VRFAVHTLGAVVLATLCACSGAAGEHGPQTTAAEVARYYRLHRWAYFVPERRAYDIDNLKSVAAAERVKREVQAGRSFASFSLHEELSRAHGPSAERRPIERAIFAARPGLLGGPVLLSEYGDHSLFEVTRIVTAHYTPLAQVRDSIAARLAGKGRG